MMMMTMRLLACPAFTTPQPSQANYGSALACFLLLLIHTHSSPMKPGICRCLWCGGHNTQAQTRRDTRATFQNPGEPHGIELREAICSPHGGN
jgi:hypothetical protein